MTTNYQSHSIVFLERNTFNVEFRRPDFPHEWVEFDEISPDEIVRRLQDATIVICNKLPLRRETLSQLPGLKLVAVAATGVDNVDLEYCRAHQISVINTRGYAVNSLPEHALMFMLALRRNLLAYREDINRGAWSEAKQFCLLDHSINDLQGSTIGIVGFGELGQSMARLAAAIGMNVLIAERKNAQISREGRTAFVEVLKQSNIVTLHCPLTPETENLIASDELNLMRSDSILINTARGALIDDQALLRALLTKRIAGAGIDVLRQEPPRDKNPLVEARLSNLIITPHNAWASQQAMQTLANQLVDNLEAFVRGEPRNLVV
ncbi:MAG TPA: D-2-hydroxyacid dehydrogenase [Pyrinomonadaceae bacterium]|nr:D-2-hydroxyacid dehydrogenase [Pyrinomonadaceae bacterium]